MRIAFAYGRCDNHIDDFRFLGYYKVKLLAIEMLKPKSFQVTPPSKWRYTEQSTGVEFIDMHNISADFLDKKFSVKRLPEDKEKAKAKVEEIKKKAGDVYFKKDHTHASKAGAQMNAQSFAKGLRQNNSELAKYLKK